MSFLNAIRYVDFWRSQVDISEEAGEIERPNPRSGPRWVPFIIGTLPALIKIASFSGVPWSKCWGLMFGLSYLLLELVNIVSSHASQEPLDSTAAALGFSTDRWDLDINRRVRMRAATLDEGLFTIGFLARHSAFIAQGILALWVVHDLRRLLTPGTFFGAGQIDHPIALLGLPFAFIYLSAAAMGIYYFAPTSEWRRRFANVWNGRHIRIFDDYWKLVSSSSWSISLVRMNARLTNQWQHLSSNSFVRTFIGMTSHILNTLRRGRLDFYFSIGFATTLRVIAPLVGAGYRSPDTIVTTSNLIAIPIGFLAVVGFSVLVFVTQLCHRAPSIGKALLIMRSIEIVDDADESTSRRVDVVDQYGAICVTFFCIHLLLGIVWYAKIYSPSGTMNPSWTNVFG